MGRTSRSSVQGLDLVLALATLTIASIALRAGHWVAVTGVGIPAPTLAQIDYGVNIGFQIGLIAAAISSACQWPWPIAPW